MNKYVVIGNPVKHSLSPQMHRLFAEQVGVEIDYQHKLVEVGDFSAQVNAFRAEGGKGASVTVPFKLDAFAYADELTQRAQRAGAVSVMKFSPDKAMGDNLDGLGLVVDLSQRLGWVLAGKTILIIGAGGATRGVVYPLAQAQPAALVIANRTPEKAQKLAQDFSDQGCVRAHQGDFADLAGKAFDVIINATSASLLGEVPAIPPSLIQAETCCYDMMYSKKPTAFMRWVANLGCQHVSDGLGMLVGQGALSFEWWFGIKPDFASAYQTLRAV